MKTPATYPIVLFDGVCNLCNATVQFIIRHDPQRQFRFAALQSETGRKLSAQCNLPRDHFDTFVLAENGRCYTRSTGALRVIRHFPGLWPLLYALIVIPRPLRDFCYNLVARRRYAWFGKREECMLPTPELRERFLQ